MLVFLVCQLPDYVTDLIESIFGISTPKSIRHAILFMQLVNNILNPFLYSILSRNFKVELGDLVRGMSGRLT
ncbi:hypothetical protein DdX_15337 [Ditylenchus destructor]|nr:hypothetical protein DdX_15337 [Ditylenchus destructor]